MTGALGKPFGPDVAEQLVSGAELLTRVDSLVLATEPFAVSEPGAGEVDYPVTARESLDPPLAELATLGVARVSWATLLYRDAMAHFEDQLASLQE